MTKDDPEGWRPDGLVVLRGGGSSVILQRRRDGLPEIVHWGADLGRIENAADLLSAGEPAVPQSALDQAWPLTLLPTEIDGWSGRPSLSAHRGGRPVIAGFPGAQVSLHGTKMGPSTLTVRASDTDAGVD